MINNSFSDNLEMTEKAREALRKSKEKKEVPIKEEKRDYTKELMSTIYEEFSDSVFEEKVKTDIYVFNRLLENVEDEQDLKVLEEVIGSMMTTVKDIYQAINIKPEINGFKNRNRSPSLAYYENEADSIITSHLKKHYFDLSSEQKKRKYEKLVSYDSFDSLMTEGFSTEEEIQEKVQEIYKSSIVETLIDRTCFPVGIEGVIKDLTTSESFRMFFESEVLIGMLEDFQNKKKILSNSIAKFI